MQIYLVLSYKKYIDYYIKILYNIYIIKKKVLWQTNNFEPSEKIVLEDTMMD